MQMPLKDVKHKIFKTESPLNIKIKRTPFGLIVFLQFLLMKLFSDSVQIILNHFIV